MFGIYFDDPNMLVDPKDFRIILGVSIDKMKHQVSEILQFDNSLKYIDIIEGSTCLYAKFPYKNNFSFLVSSLNTYP